MAEWAQQLRDYEDLLRQKFRKALEGDFLSHQYPPSYDFSGSRYAGDDSGLQILDDYQSTRRSLRHKLEGLIRENHRYSWFVLVRAARERHRFEHPGWAPWSPLDWYERLIEPAELYFGRTPMTLELMQDYVRCLSETAAHMLAFVVETVEACGLVQEPVSEVPPDAQARPELSASWSQRPERGPGATPENAAPGGRPATANLASEGRRDGRGTGLPAPDATASAWMQWAASQGLLRRAGAGDDHGAELPGTAAGDKQEKNARGAALETPVAAILAGVFSRVRSELRCHAEVRGLMRKLQPILVHWVSRDLEFFHDPAHPLRVWVGSLINTGIRIGPEIRVDESTVVAGYLTQMQHSVESLQQASGSLDRAAMQSLLDAWRQALAAADSRWRGHAQEVFLEPLCERERAARARRNLTVCVLETEADLPAAAAEEIMRAWEAVLAVDESAAQPLDAAVHEVVRAICQKATPQSVNPLVQRIAATARAHQLEEERVRLIVQHLGRAHLRHLRTTSGESRFDPGARLHTRRSTRLEDDDPDLLTDLDDEWVFEASRIRVDDWFEQVDKASGQVHRMGLLWRGEATRAFLFVSLDRVTARRHSLQGVAQELREGRMRPLPADNPLDMLLT